MRTELILLISLHLLNMEHSDRRCSGDDEDICEEDVSDEDVGEGGDVIFDMIPIQVFLLSHDSCCVIELNRRGK